MNSLKANRWKKFYEPDNFLRNLHKYTIMIYNNSDVRRQDRLLDEDSALAILKSGEYGVLSMIDEKGSVYGVPLNYVWDGENSIYVHCATEGRKLRSIDKNPAVSFCVVGKTNVISAKFTTEYESIILECVAERNLSYEIRMKALMLLVDKYSPEFQSSGKKSAENAFKITEVIRLQIVKWSGKRKTSNY